MAAGKAVQESVNSSASSTAGTMHLKCLIKPPAQPVVHDFQKLLWHTICVPNSKSCAKLDFFDDFLVSKKQGNLTVRFIKKKRPKTAFFYALGTRLAHEIIVGTRLIFKEKI